MFKPPLYQTSPSTEELGGGLGSSSRSSSSSSFLNNNDKEWELEREHIPGIGLKVAVLMFGESARDRNPHAKGDAAKQYV
jgi:hypothetical protein